MTVLETLLRAQDRKIEACQFDPRDLVAGDRRILLHSHRRVRACALLLETQASYDWTFPDSQL